MFKLSLKIIVLLVVFAHSSAQAQCSSTYKEVPIVTKLATSSTYSNMRGSADSLKTLSKEIMLSAIAGSSAASPPESFCPKGCKTKVEPQIIFSSTPNKYLTEYSDQSICQELKQKTLLTPIEFKNKIFATQEDLNSYYSDLCRGSGVDGKELYKICHSSCSPSYKSTIFKNGDGYQMDTEIVCAEARDKSEGMYRLSSFYRWSCETI